MVIGIDFDGTCVKDKFPLIGESISSERVLKRLSEKHNLILYTVRDGIYLAAAKEWFKANDIKLYSANFNPCPVTSSPKLYCDYYIDDRNIGTPLTEEGYVDWEKMEKLLEEKGLI